MRIVTNESTSSRRELGWQSHGRLDGHAGHVENALLKLGHQVDHLATVGGEDVGMLSFNPRDQPLQAPVHRHHIYLHLPAPMRADLLVLDDFGLKPMQPPAAQDLYDIINERYEKGAILLTSNHAPAEWATWFADPLLASAGLDRLAHRAPFLIITGNSYRAKDRLAEKGGELT